ncbi:MAG: 2-C-methyl-D-erythritol 2,4-cyclodiphosphate synthase [Candidatus Eremiobacteraeota bacterium]|nr:2-C-methyl-D-erythritol 2,4-cyclodiphosphate synthase [Candidatus Eremiobacteraeota bacterium]MBV8367039.1 2-C-methyl-D-erythritol 2,4-cyclodiphosphate synthase [Candidatus Eremiobacteraeota bacterium]
MRIGFGFDAHRLVNDRPLVLGGVRVPHDKGLEGFSDADVLMHALIDAVLGAAALGDCGTHFPAGEARFANAHSLKLLELAIGMVRRAGWQVGNVDCTIVAERPALAGHLGAMRAIIANALQIPEAACNVKAKHTEGLGFTGSGEGMAAFAVAMLQPSEQTAHEVR